LLYESLDYMKINRKYKENAMYHSSCYSMIKNFGHCRDDVIIVI
jgi:hypothetical protein